MPGKQDYYQLLGIRRDATQEDIKRAYYEAAQKLHPGKNTAVGETEIFLDIQQAYETLSNPKRRAQYDSVLPPEEKIKLPYQYNLIFSRSSLVHMAEPQMLYMILELEAPLEARPSPAPPLNVCLVLDRPTSMKGEKMDVVKAAAVQVSPSTGHAVGSSSNMVTRSGTIISKATWMRPPKTTPTCAPCYLSMVCKRSLPRSSGMN